MKKNLAVLLFVIISIPLFSVNHYVKNGGNDGNTGLSDAQAWATISKVNGHTFAAGDQVLFKRGSTWIDETLNITNNGSVGNPIVYGAYDVGARPIITGRFAVPGWSTPGNWTNGGSNRWNIATDFTNRLWINGTEALKCANTAVTVSQNFYHNGTRLYVYSTSNPSSAFSLMEGGYTMDIINGTADYITIQNLDLRAANWRTIAFTGVDNWIIEDCDIGRDCMSTGVYSNGAITSNVIIRRCTFDTYDRAVDPFESNNTFEAICLWDGGDTWDIYDNTFTDWGHAALAIQVNSAATPVSHIKFHHNICTAKDIDYGRAFNFEFYPTLGNSHGNEVYNNFFYSFGVHNLISGDGVKVYNNIFDGIRTTPYSFAENSGCINMQPYVGISSNNEIYNNVIMNCAGSGLSLWWYSRALKTNAIRNNIFYNNGLEADNYQIGYDGEGGGNYYENNIFQNNLFYSSATNDVIFDNKYTDHPFTVAEFNAKNGSTNSLKAGCGTDIIGNNIGGDPLFVDATNSDYLLRDYHLKTGSPAIGKGVNVGLLTDYSGNAWQNPPSIGAFEYNSGISNIPPIVSITSPTNGSTFTTPTDITITSNASDSDGTITKVEFYNGLTKLGESTIPPYLYTWNNVSTGTYSLTAVATDNLNAKTTSLAVSVIVNTVSSNIPPTVSITSPTNGSTFTTPVNITITSNASDVDGTILKVEFYNGGTKLGEKTTVPYSFTWNSVPIGTYSFSVVATDNLNAKTTSAIMSVMVNSGSVNNPPTVSITSPTNGSTFTAPASITITSNVSDSDGTISRVEFYNGTSKLGEKLSAPYSYTWNNVNIGTYSLTVVATDDLNAKTTSAIISVTVNSGSVNNPPTVIITSPAISSTYTAPANISISANASDMDGTIIKVEFYNGITKLGESSIFPYSYVWNNVPAGTYSLTAVTTDNLNAKTTSAAVTITVNPGSANDPPSVLIISPGNGSTFTVPATITITANATDTDGTISKVEFFNGTSKLGEIASFPYSYVWNDVIPGNYSLTAVVTDNLNAKTTSSVISVTVTSDILPVNNSPTIYISSPRSNSTFIASANINITVIASDTDGSISKVEFFNGAIKLGEKLTAPFSYLWSNVDIGNYVLTSIATDNLSATTTSNSIEIFVIPDGVNADLIILYPNPNTGKFSIDITTPPPDNQNNISIFDNSGKKVYDGILLKEEITKQFDLSYLDAGLFTLIITGNKIFAIKRIIIN